MSLGPSLNSASGGKFNFVSGTHPSVKLNPGWTFVDYPANQPRTAELNAKAASLMRDDLRIQSTDRTPRSKGRQGQMTQAAQASTVAALACVRTIDSPGTPVLSACIASDITVEAFNAKPGEKLGFYDQHTGQGPNSIDQHWRLATGEFTKPPAEIYHSTFDLFSGTLSTKSL